MDVCNDKWFGMKTVDKIIKNTNETRTCIYILLYYIRNSFVRSRTSAPRAHDKEITMSDILLSTI